MLTRMQQRRGTMADWASVANTVILAQGEVGLVTDGVDKGKFKIGDGTTQWSSLAYYWSDANNALIYSKLVASQTFLGTQTLSSSAIAAPAIIVKGASGQTGNIQEWRSPDGSTLLSAISSTGAFSANAASATILQTSRTIWGQTFNGSANVSGSLTGVGTNITASAALTVASAAASAITLASGTTGSVTVDSGTTGAVSIGNNANAKTITIGNVTGATGIVLNSGTAGITYNHLAGSQSKFVATAAPTSDMVTISNSGFATITSGASALAITYAGGAAAVTGYAQEILVTPGTTAAGQWGALAITPSAAAAASVVQNGIKFNNITAGAGQDNMIYAGTGWTNILSYNGTTVINGTGNVIAGQLTGTIPSGVLTNSTVYIGTTAIALNRASGIQSLTGISIDGQAGTVAQSLAIKFDAGATEGTSLYTFNGGTAKTIDIKGSSTVSITKAAGVITLSAIAAVTTSATAPATPFDNQLWFNSELGSLFVRYNDGNTTQWTEVKTTTTTLDTTYVDDLADKMMAFQIMGVL